MAARRPGDRSGGPFRRETMPQRGAGQVRRRRTATAPPTTPARHSTRHPPAAAIQILLDRLLPALPISEPGVGVTAVGRSGLVSVAGMSAVRALSRLSRP